MTRQEWLDGLKVGDEVIVEGGLSTYERGTIKNINTRRTEFKVQTRTYIYRFSERGIESAWPKTIMQPIDGTFSRQGLAEKESKENDPSYP